MAKLNPQRLIFGLFLLVLIVVMELVFHNIHISENQPLPGWPAFMVMVFFFVEHMDVKKASHILVGGLVGILSIVGLSIFVTVLAPVIGHLVSVLLYICLAVYAIVAFGEIVPMVFNNYAFMFLTVTAGVASANPAAANPFLWMAIELVGGAIAIAGVIGILKLMGTLFTPQTPAEAQQEAASEG